MKGLGIRTLVICGFALLLIGCGGTAPQRPSQRMGLAPEADSTQLALMELNMQLAQAADHAVQEAAQAQEEAYALYDGPAWVHIDARGDETRPALLPFRSCTAHMRVYALNGNLLEDTEGTYTIGRHELPQGVEPCVRERRPGAKARLFVPWYAAFGMKGTAHIPPYENVIIDLQIVE